MEMKFGTTYVEFSKIVVIFRVRMCYISEMNDFLAHDSMTLRMMIMSLQDSLCVLTNEFIVCPFFYFPNSHTLA